MPMSALLKRFGIFNPQKIARVHVEAVADAMRDDGRLSDRQHRQLLKKIGEEEQPKASGVLSAAKKSLSRPEFNEFREFLSEASQTFFTAQRRNKLGRKKNIDPTSFANTHFGGRYAVSDNFGRLLAQHPNGDKIAESMKNLAQKAGMVYDNLPSVHTIAEHLDGFNEKHLEERLEQLHNFVDSHEQHKHYLYNALRLGTHAVKHFLRVVPPSEDNRDALLRVLNVCKNLGEVRQTAAILKNVNLENEHVRVYVSAAAANNTHENKFEGFANAMKFLDEYQSTRKPVSFLSDRVTELKGLIKGDEHESARWSAATALLAMRDETSNILGDELWSQRLKDNGGEKLFEEIANRTRKISMVEGEAKQIPSNEREEFRRAANISARSSGILLTAANWPIIKQLKPLFSKKPQITEEDSDREVNELIQKFDFEEHVLRPLFSISNDENGFRENVEALKKFASNRKFMGKYGEGEHNPMRELCGYLVNGEYGGNLDKSSKYNYNASEWKARVLKHIAACHYLKRLQAAYDNNMAAPQGYYHNSAQFFGEEHPRKDILAMLGNSDHAFSAFEAIENGLKQVAQQRNTDAELIQQLLEVEHAKSSFKDQQDFERRMGAAIARSSPDPITAGRLKRVVWNTSLVFRE